MTSGSLGHGLGVAAGIGIANKKINIFTAQNLRMEQYDVCVIGGGPAGYAAAMRAIDYKKKVVLIEKSKVGGTGIYNGALSSKTLWEISEKLYDINETIASKNREKFELPWSDVIQTMKEAIFDRKIQYSAHITLLQEESKHGQARYPYHRIDPHQHLVFLQTLHNSFSLLQQYCPRDSLDTFLHRKCACKLEHQ